MTSFIQFVRMYQQRDVVVQGMPLSSDITGIWLPASTADYVIYNESLHPIQQMHGTLHEFAHILLGHEPLPIAEALPNAITSQISGGNPLRGRMRQVGRMLGDPLQEAEAEAFVLLVQRDFLFRQRIDRWMGAKDDLTTFSILSDGLGFKE